MLTEAFLFVRGSSGKMDLINRLLLDAGITAELAKHWSEQELWVAPICIINAKKQGHINFNLG